MRRRSPILLALLVWASTAPAGRADSVPWYTVTDLGPSSPSEASYGLAINAGGQVAGAARAKEAVQAFRASGGGSVQMLGSLAGERGHSRGLDIDAGGLVVGVSDYAAGAPRAFRAGPEGLIDLGTLPGGTWSEAVAIGGGMIAGTGDRGDGRTVAFRIGADGAFEDLGFLPGGFSSRAFGINDHGTVVGQAEDRWGIGRAFIAEGPGVGTSTGIRAVGTLPGGGASTARAINNDGLITGYAVDSSGAEMAFIGRPGRLSALGVLPGGSASYGLDIDGSGQVVGKVATGGGARAFLWTAEHGMTDLNELIDPRLGWTLQVASGINDEGMIVGTGLFNGVSRAFLLRPVTGSSGGPPPGTDPPPPGGSGGQGGSTPTHATPEPGTWLLSMLGGLGMLAYTRARRPRSPSPLAASGPGSGDG